MFNPEFDAGGKMIAALNTTKRHIYTGDVTYGRKADGSVGGVKRVAVTERASFRKRRAANKQARVSRRINRRK